MLISNPVLNLTFKNHNTELNRTQILLHQKCFMNSLLKIEKSSTAKGCTETYSEPNLRVNQLYRKSLSHQIEKMGMVD